MRDRWFLFPMRGLGITDESADLEHPMFMDSTVLSRQHIPEIVSQIKAVKLARGMDPRIAEVSTNQLARSLESADDDLGQPMPVEERPSFQSFIAVKRGGKFYPEGISDPKTTEAANLRAKEIASLLTLVFLARNEKAQTCGLVEEMQIRRGAFYQFELIEGYAYSSRLGTSGSIIRSKHDELQTSRAQLLELLQSEEYRPLAQILLRQPIGVDESLLTAVHRSALQLSSAIHSTDASVQLLSAVTALEILLTFKTDEVQMGSIYGNVERRLSGLLGKDCVTRYKASDVFKARHAYVHEGDILEVPFISMRAVGLALACLLRYAEAAPKFHHKKAFMTYLDFVAQSDELPNGWGPDQEQLLGTPLLHTREGIFFKWQRGRLGLGWPLEKKRPRGPLW